MTAQEITIVGQVSSFSDGETLPGVSVVVVGTSNGTTTDLEGKYSIIAKTGDILEFSYIGMKTIAITIAEKTEINVSLQENAAALDEIVIVGYGSMKKADLTGAVSSVKGESLAKASVPNLSAALAGKVTGVITTQTTGQPGLDGTTFQIRGISTSGNNSPLFIVDGVERSFSRVDPNDVESVTVLKDAASTAVYGARAANGVLLITTKRGKEGKTVFDYTGSYGFQSQTKEIELMDSGEYAKYLNEAYVNFGNNPRYTDAEVQTLTNGPSYDWLGSVLGASAPIQKHNLSARGGSEKMKYFLSYGVLEQDGFYKTAKYKQNNLRVNVDAQLTDRIDVTVDLAGRISDRTTPPSGVGNIYQGAMFGHPFLNPNLDEEVGPGALGFNGFSGNPQAAAEGSGTSENINNVFESNFSLKYKVPGVEGLVAKAFYAYDYSNSIGKTFRFPYTFYQFNEVTNEYTKLTGGASSTSLSESRSYNKKNTLQLSLNYSKEFGDHKISALGLYEEVSTYYNYISAFRDDFISTAIPELFAGDVELWQNNGRSSESIRRGYVGRVDYDFKGKYLLQANLRVDQSYNFPKDGRTGYFPAVSAGWKMSEEDFLINNNTISNLKLRASYGVVGNDRVPAFDFLYNFAFNGGTALGSNTFNTGIIDTGLPNVNITWEEAKTFDIGFDLGLFNNKLTVEADYFKKRTENILIRNSGEIPLTSGFGTLPNENLGIIDAWGSEGVVTYRNNIGDLNFTIGANYTWFNNEVIKTSESETVLPAIAQTGRALGLRTGYKSNGLFQTQEEIDNAPIQHNTSIHNSLRPGDIRYVDINGRDADGNLTGAPDGKINADDRTIIGASGDPNWVFGLNINLEYRGFDLIANFQGATEFSRFIRPIPFERDNNTFSELIDSWRVGNENAKYPRLSHGDLPANNNFSSDFWITDVSYVRLKNLNIGYNFIPEKNVLSRAGIDGLRVSVSGTNLVTISNLDWRDPEGGSGGIPFYPQVKTMSLGVNVKF